MPRKNFSNHSSKSLTSNDKDIIVEELLENFKTRGFFDDVRKQYLSELTNKSSYQNLHTKVENLSTKFLKNVRWPPSVQKHQLRDQLRLNIQSTDEVNNSISRLIEQKLKCKSPELKPMIEREACGYLEIDHEKWKQNMLTKSYDVESPREEFSQKELSPISVKVDIKQENTNIPTKIDMESNETIIQNLSLKVEQSLNQSNVVNSSSLNSVVTATSKFAQKSPHITQANFVPTLPPPIGLLPPPHQILPNNLFQPLPPPPLFLPIERFPPPPPPEDKSLPPPPPPENGPNTPTEEYVPTFYNAPENPTEKIKIGLLKTQETTIEENTETKIISPKKIIWGDVVLPIHDISDDSISDIERNEHERSGYSPKSPQLSRIPSKIKGYMDSLRKYRVFGRSQSDERDMDISLDTQSPSLDPKWDSPIAEINLDSVESVQLRKNQIKAR